MIVFLLRHGHAESYASSDQERPLSDQGLLEIDKVLKPIMDELAGLDAVWVSPYLRTQQTWSRVSAQFLQWASCQHLEQTSDAANPSAFPSFPRAALLEATLPQAIIYNGITPSGNVRETLLELETAQCKRILLVTHQPLVGSLLDTLCGFESNRHFMGTANLAAIRLDDELPLSSGLGELLWLKRPV